MAPPKDIAVSDGLAADLPRSVLDNLLEGCQLIGRDYRYLYVNKAVLVQGKTTREALIGRTMMECYPGIELTPMFSALRRSMESGVAQTMENRFEFTDGSFRWFELRFEPVDQGVTILSIDITERKQWEESLQQTMRVLQTLSRCNQTLVRATDEQHFVRDVCNLLVESGGYRAATIDLSVSDAADAQRPGAQAGDLYAARHDERLSLEVHAEKERVATLTVFLGDREVRDATEREMLDEIASDLGHGIGTLRARVAHASAEEQLAATSRMEAVGRLAGGLAHDFNNLLSVILIYAGFVGDTLQESDPAREDIDQVREAGERAADLIRQLLAFSRKQIMKPQVTNMNTVIRGIEPLLRRLLGEDIVIEINPADDLGNVLADPGQVEQVIMNLALNARDAMHDGGKLTIATQNVEPNDAEIDCLATEGRDEICVSVTDSGAGMNEKTRQRIFEPFFTTRNNKGTGLGLSMVYGIVKQSGGNVRVFSKLGRGTTFEICLPRINAPAVAPAPIKHVTTAGRETILLVEDEATVRKATARILESAGYTVLSAANGSEGLRQFDAHHGPIDLLLTDVIIPGMSGRELADKLKAIKPELRVLFASGYSDNVISHHGVLDADTNFLAKPFSATDLTQRVRDVLDAGS